VHVKVHNHIQILNHEYNEFFSLFCHPYTAEFVAQYFLDNIFKLHGMLASTVSDKDPIFLSSFLALNGGTTVHTTLPCNVHLMKFCMVKTANTLALISW
ncbi:MAG: hypothetical protein Q8811_02855, partial [Candidatus Phytoplasma australasiaticum]|nr:hypothetical protein [Candidatus Phytoplasma australasiaticum]